LGDKVVITGSGFQKYEPVAVSLNYGGGNQKATVATFIDTNGGGAFKIELDPIRDAGSVNGRKSQIVAAGVVTVLASGADGSEASAPAVVHGDAPPLPEPPPDTAPTLVPNTDGSLTASSLTATVGDVVTVYAGGFRPDERATLNVVTGARADRPTGLRWSKVGEGFASENGVITYEWTVSASYLGAISLKADGTSGTTATTVVVVSEAK